MQRIKRIPRKIAVKILIAAVIALAAFSTAIIINSKKEDTVKVTSLTSVIKEVVNTTKLNVAEYPFNGVAKWFEQNPDGSQTRVGYIEYKGIIKYSLDFSKVEVAPIDDKGVIRILIPEITTSASLSPEDMICIFTSKQIKKDYNNSAYQQNIYKTCEDDLLWSVQQEDAIINSVKEYTTKYITSLVEPFLADENYTFEVIYGV